MQNKSVVSTVDRFLEWFLVSLMGLSVLNVLWQVFTRFILEDPSTYTEELARYLLIWIGVLGAAYAVGKRAHLALDLLPEKLKGRQRLQLDIVIEGFVIVFALTVMVLGGARLVYIQYILGQASASLDLPMAFVYSVVPVSGLLIVFYSVVHITDRVTKLRLLDARVLDEEDIVEPDEKKEALAKDLHID